eukprot:g869.t1
MDGFQSRLNALEGVYFRGREQTTMETYVRRLVQEGKLPNSALEVFDQQRPETRVRPASEFVYHHKPGQGVQIPSRSPLGLGQSVRLGGNSRWSVGDVSIFDVHKGKELAATPRRQPSVFEIKRAQAIEKAATESPLVGKYRLYPRLSPARAFFWGTLVACTGMMIGTKIACLCLDIKKVDDVADRMKKALDPLKSSVESVFTPVNGALLSAGAGSVDSSTLNRFAYKLKQKFTHHQN